MRRLPHIPPGDIPRAVLELGDLSDIHPASVLPNRNFMVRTDPKPFALLLYHDLFAWTNGPCA